MRVREHALSIAFGIIFVLALIGQSIAGLFEFNEKQESHGAPPVSWGEFVTSSDFVVQSRVLLDSSDRTFNLGEAHL